jgi:hypothetical protein
MQGVRIGGFKLWIDVLFSAIVLLAKMAIEVAGEHAAMAEAQCRRHSV